MKTSLVAGLLLLFNIVHCDCKTLQEGVDLVTKVSNDLIPFFLTELAANNSNVIIGPFGVTSNLAMILEASSGKTRQEILRVLGVVAEDLETLRVGFKAYCELFLEHSVSPDSSGSFNSVSVGAGFKVQPAYKDILTKYYCANVTGGENEDGPSLKFDSHAGVMSHWKDFEKLAVYTFLSHHDMKYFQRNENESVQVPMIPQVGVFRTGIWDKSRIIMLPLQSKMANLMILVPDDSKRISTIMKQLNADVISRLTHVLYNEEMDVFLPQMTTVSKGINLSDILKARGIDLAFDNTKADLTRASNKSSRVFVQSISQNAYFSLSFVAINSVSGVSSSLELKRRPKREDSKVYITQPFIFLVLHPNTNLVLLAGSITNPIQVPI